MSHVQKNQGTLWKFSTTFFSVVTPMPSSHPCGAWKTIENPYENISGLFATDLPAAVYYPSNDTYIETMGCGYRQLHQDYPFLRPLYFDMELNFDAFRMVYFADQFFWMSFVVCAGYFAFLYFGTKIVKAWSWKLSLYNEMIAWNALLSIFSFIGFWRTAPHLLNNLARKGFYHTVRNIIWGRGGSRQCVAIPP